MLRTAVKCFFEKETGTSQYVVHCTKTLRAAILDSVLDYDPVSGHAKTQSAEKIVHFVQENNLHVDWLLETHPHADHLSASRYLKHIFPEARIAIGNHVVDSQQVFKDLYNVKDFKTDGSQFDKLWADGEHFNIGELDVEVLHTPGHTPACVCYYIREDAIFVGDTIFMPDMGTARCDFPGGSVTRMWASIQRILTLPRQTRLFVGHDYAPGGRELACETTIDDQLKSNKHVKEGTSEHEFVQFRTKRDAELTLPRLIHPSMQFNIRAGSAPEPEDNGQCYIKIPISLPLP